MQWLLRQRKIKVKKSEHSKKGKLYPRLFLLQHMADLVHLHAFMWSGKEKLREKESAS